MGNLGLLILWLFEICIWRLWGGYEHISNFIIIIVFYIIFSSSVNYISQSPMNIGVVFQPSFILTKILKSFG